MFPLACDAVGIPRSSGKKTLYKRLTPHLADSYGRTKSPGVPLQYNDRLMAVEMLKSLSEWSDEFDTARTAIAVHCTKRRVSIRVLFEGNLLLHTSLHQLIFKKSDPPRLEPPPVVPAPVVAAPVVAVPAPVVPAPVVAAPAVVVEPEDDTGLIRRPVCVVCIDQGAEYAGACGHLCACGRCRAQLRSCPVCRAANPVNIRIFF